MDEYFQALKQKNHAVYRHGWKGFVHNSNEIIIARLPDIIILALLLSLLLDDDDVTFALGRVIFLERERGSVTIVE